MRGRYLLHATLGVLVPALLSAAQLKKDSDYFMPVVIALMILSVPLGFFMGSALGLMVVSLRGMGHPDIPPNSRRGIQIGGGLGVVLGPLLVVYFVLL